MTDLSVYLHIPYCERACSYCDFYFSTNLTSRSAFTEALLKEIALTAPIWGQNRTVKTVYFGGGTPTLLPPDDLRRITESLHRHFSFADNIEFTVEANPNDLNPPLLKALKGLGVNRLSIGIQSFLERELRWMNRSHDAGQALRCVPTAQDAGFENITIDLIYDTPTLTDDEWEQTLRQATALKVPHISAYALTVEPKTKLAHDLKKGLMPEPQEDRFVSQFEMLHHILEAQGFEGYEISNFAQRGYRSVHNSNYWKRVAYLGLGPSAHGFDGEYRYANESNLHSYIDRINATLIYDVAKEKLSPEDELNERLMTRLRMIEGFDLRIFPEGILVQKQGIIREMERNAWLTVEDDRLKLTLKGKAIANYVIERLMV